MKYKIIKQMSVTKISLLSPKDPNSIALNTIVKSDPKLNQKYKKYSIDNIKQHGQKKQFIYLVNEYQG